MNYREWEETVPASIRDDALWRVSAYRMALFLGDVAWRDATRLSKDHRTAELSGQLYRAVGSVSANLAEGYSRGTGRDRARFYEYALGSARESRDWFFKCRHLLGTEVAGHRMNMLAEIVRLLLVMIPQQRTTAMLKEDELPYGEANVDDPAAPAILKDLSLAVPFAPD